MLLGAGADPRARDSKGWTPLHWAAAKNIDSDALSVVKKLLDAGADPQARTEAGERPRDLVTDARSHLRKSDLFERRK